MEMGELCIQIDNLVLRIADPSLDSIVVKTIATKLTEFDVKKDNLSKEIVRTEAMIKGYESIQKLTNTQSKIEMYAKSLKI